MDAKFLHPMVFPNIVRSLSTCLSLSTYLFTQCCYFWAKSVILATEVLFPKCSS